MRHVQVLVPDDRVEAVTEMLEDEGFDYLRQRAWYGNEEEWLVAFPVPTDAVGYALDRLEGPGSTATGTDGDEPRKRHDAGRRNSRSASPTSSTDGSPRPRTARATSRSGSGSTNCRTAAGLRSIWAAREGRPPARPGAPAWERRLFSSEGNRARLRRASSLIYRSTL